MWYFVSKYKNYSLQVTIEGVKQTINFRDIGNYPAAFAGGGIFETDDEDIIAALQAHPKYAGDYKYIEGGKEFTGTDEGPMITWGDTSEYPSVTPQDGKIYRFIVPEDGTPSDDSIIEDGDIYWDGTDLILRKNRSPEALAQMSAIHDLMSHYIYYTMSLLYAETAGIGEAQQVPLSFISQAYPPFAPAILYLHAVVIENLGPSVTLSVNCNTQVVLPGITIDSGEKKIFIVPSQRPIDTLASGGGNSTVGISRPVATTTIRYQFIFASIR